MKLINRQQRDDVRVRANTIDDIVAAKRKEAHDAIHELLNELATRNRETQDGDH
jgi:hypothetical protein